MLTAGDIRTANASAAPTQGFFSSSPVAAGRFIYATNEKGLLQVVDTSKPEGELVSEMDLGETILGTPAISGNALYLRSDGKLWKISGSSNCRPEIGNWPLRRPAGARLIRLE